MFIETFLEMFCAPLMHGKLRKTIAAKLFFPSMADKVDTGREHFFYKNSRMRVKKVKDHCILGYTINSITYVCGVCNTGQSHCILYYIHLKKS